MAPLCYISSTFSDLMHERKLVFDWLAKQAGLYTPVNSEAQSPHPVLKTCFDDIQRCDIYILLLGARYGTRSDSEYGEGLSYTHHEFRHAKKLGKQCFAFQMEASKAYDGVTPADVESSINFRKEVGSYKKVAADKLIDELSTSLAQAEPWRLIRWRIRQLAYRELLALGVELTLMRIPAGSFLMGAAEEEEGSRANERPLQRVQVGEFLMGRTPVTQAQWRAVAKWEPKEGEKPWGMDLDPDPSRFKGANRPVERVGWAEAREFCRRLRQRTGKNYHLPSEARWEYACRADTTTPFHFGTTLTTELANCNSIYSYGDGPKGAYRQKTVEVASFPGNAWGLHDMHGNVWEWCADHWHDTYNGAPADGSPWINDKSNDAGIRLLRGGSWNDNPGYCRSACRDAHHPVGQRSDVGFRVCCLPQDLLLYT
jgi:formylglycine-generating enzyme required for sulfatase activity